MESKVKSGKRGIQIELPTFHFLLSTPLMSITGERDLDSRLACECLVADFRGDYDVNIGLAGEGGDQLGVNEVIARIGQGPKGDSGQIRVTDLQCHCFSVSPARADDSDDARTRIRTDRTWRGIGEGYRVVGIEPAAHRHRAVDPVDGCDSDPRSGLLNLDPAECLGAVVVYQDFNKIGGRDVTRQYEI